MAGYSGTPLAKKLGIKEGHRVGLINAPAVFADLVAPLPEGVEVLTDVRSRRDVVVAFLRERGCAVAVTTWATATAEQCDAHDVVLADSPTFNQVRGKKVDVRKFPATKAPVVAVGFLGTQLLEANRIAMACGYI